MIGPRGAQRGLPVRSLRRGLAWPVIALLLAGCAPAPGPTTVILEEFSDGVIDTTRYQVNGPVSEADGVFSVAHPAGSIGIGRLRTHPRAKFAHDVDAQVSFVLEGFVPPTTPHRALGVALAVEAAGEAAIIECYVAPPLDCNPARYSYKAWVGSALNCAPGTQWAVADSTRGRFRIRRARGNVELSYWKDGEWVVLKTAPFTSAPLQVTFYSVSAGHLAAPTRPRRTLFDDLRIETSGR